MVCQLARSEFANKISYLLALVSINISQEANNAQLIKFGPAKGSMCLNFQKSLFGNILQLYYAHINLIQSILRVIRRQHLQILVI